MKELEDANKGIQTKAAKLLGSCETVFMATNGAHGHPNVRAMMPLKVDGTHTLWFITGSDYSKVAELENDNKAAVYAYDPRKMNECRLWGSVEILSDAATIEQVWRDEFKNFFDGPEDPKIRVLRFDADNGVYVEKDKEPAEFKNEP